MKTRVTLAVFIALIVWAFFCFVFQSHGRQAFTPLRPFILQSATVSNQTPEQLAEFQVAFRWVASDLGTSSLSVNILTDRIQGAAWRMDDATKQPAYTTNGGIALNTTHWLTNFVLGSCLNGQSNMCFGMILSIASYGNSMIRPTLFNNSLRGSAGGSEDQYSLEQGFYNLGDNKFHPMDYFAAGGDNTYGFASTTGYPLTNVWHALMFGQYFTNHSVVEPNIYLITNGVYYTNYHITAWSSGGGWGGPFSITGNRSNFPVVLGYNYLRNSAVTYNWKEFWIWTNTAVALDPPSASVRTNFYIYGSTTYGF